MALGEWLRLPRRPLAMFFGITVVSAAALVWLSWEVVRQDRALAGKRAEERRDNAAGLAVAALQKHLSELEEQLKDIASAQPEEAARKAEQYSKDLSPDSALLVFDDASVDAYPAGRLIYYPVHPPAISTTQRGLLMYDPKTKKLTAIDTCFNWGHVNFDDNDVLWSSFGPAGVEGWFDVKIWDKTHDEKAAQGWSAFVLDNNGNGKRDAYTESNQPADPAKDRRLNVQYYGDSPAFDGSIWGSVQGMPGALVRFVPGAHPPETALAEYYEVPWNNPAASVQGFAPRGMDVDSKGVVWTVLSSGHLASFDRKKCKAALSGPTATGQHCPEGWTLYPLPGPNYKGGADSGSADSAYYDFVDRFDLLGVGKDVPVATGNLSEGLLALVDGKFLTFRVPYPMGFFAKGMDGRIDNPGAGWKGKGLYTSISTRAPFHQEGGKGDTSRLLKFQVRPDPLAK